MKRLLDRLMSEKGRDYEYMESEIVTRSGRNRRIAWYNTLVRDHDDIVTGVICSGADITEQKQAEDALRVSEEKYRTIIENIEEGYYEIDQKGILTFFNDKLSKILGYSHEELTGMHNRQFMNRECSPSLPLMLDEISREGISEKALDWEFVRSDGATRYLEASMSSISDGNGGLNGFRGIIRDVTDRRRGEEILRQSYEKLQRTLEGTVKALFRYC